MAWSFLGSLAINVSALCAVGVSKLSHPDAPVAPPKPDTIALLKPIKINLYKPLPPRVQPTPPPETKRDNALNRQARRAQSKAQNKSADNRARNANSAARFAANATANGDARSNGNGASGSAAGDGAGNGSGSGSGSGGLAAKALAAEGATEAAARAKAASAAIESAATRAIPARRAKQVSVATANGAHQAAIPTANAAQVLRATRSATQPIPQRNATATLHRAASLQVLPTSLLQVLLPRAPVVPTVRNTRLAPKMAAAKLLNPTPKPARPPTPARANSTRKCRAPRLPINCPKTRARFYLPHPKRAA